MHLRKRHAPARLAGFAFLGGSASVRAKPLHEGIVHAIRERAVVEAGGETRASP